MGTQGVVRLQGLGHEVRLLRLDPLVHDGSVIAVGPTVEASVADAGHVVGHQVRTQLVPLVHRGPKGSCDRLEVQAVGSAKSAGKHAPSPCSGVDGPDRRAAFLLGHAVLADVRVRPDGGVEGLSIRAGEDVLGPVVIATGGQVENPFRLSGRLGVTGPVRQADDAVVLRHIEVLADQGHAEGAADILGEGGLEFGQAVAVGVPEQGDAVWAGALDGTGLTHQQVGRPVAEAGLALLLRRGFGHQDIAIGQDQEPARVGKGTGEPGHHKALRRTWRLRARPAHRLRDRDLRDKGARRRRQLRLRTKPGQRVRRSAARTGREKEGRAEGAAPEGTGHHVEVS